MSHRDKSNSTLKYVLEAIIPFTDANLNLAFRPGAFFRELDRRGNISRSAAERAYYRAKQQGLIVFENSAVKLSPTALQLLERSQAPELAADTYLMVIFDVPEEYSHKRRQLRSLLRELKFSQKQRSVWISRHDYREVVIALINELQIDPYAKVFLATDLS